MVPTADPTSTSIELVREYLSFQNLCNRERALHLGEPLELVEDYYRALLHLAGQVLEEGAEAREAEALEELALDAPRELLEYRLGPPLGT
jgi:hypothetical protein